MKKKIFSAYDIIFIISVIAVFVYAVFVPPVHSVADQGDFERVMRPCGLDFPSDYSFYDYAVRFFYMKFHIGCTCAICAKTFIFSTDYYVYIPYRYNKTYMSAVRCV